jgi:HlyD family secretion protein
LFLLLLLSAAAGFAWKWFTQSAELPRYQTVTLKREDIVQTVTATGQLTAVVNVQVGSQISGNIQKLLVDFNSPVKAGQIVAQIDAATYTANVNANQGEVESARATLELAKLTEKRKRQLVGENAAPPADLEKAVADLNQAEAILKIKQAALERSRVDLERCTILAPVDGVVVSRNVELGQTVAASLQAPVLFTIANDLTKMNIEANVSEADIGGVREGQDVSFTVDAFPERKFQGKVTQVRYAPVIVENVVSYVTVISVANPKLELRPGMTANVAIELARRDGVLAVPNAALRFKLPSTTSMKDDRPNEKKDDKKPKSAAASKKTVYRLVNGEPKPVPVTLGIANAISTEVLEGLSEGDELVTALLNPAPAASTGGNPFSNNTRDLIPQGAGGGGGGGGGKGK